VKQEGNIKYQGGKSDTKNKFKFLPSRPKGEYVWGLKNLLTVILLNYAVSLQLLLVQRYKCTLIPNIDNYLNCSNNPYPP
jgi:hypothetical protein